MKSRQTFRELRPFLILWSTQSLSQLGSAMTSFALTLWLYAETGSALQTALLSICSYTPYVLMSIFAGALSDRWDRKKTMLACDALAAACTVVVLILLKMGSLRTWHLYALNAVNGLMNTVQSPASDVAMTLLIPKEHYQRASGLRSFSNSLITVLNPVLATSLYALTGMDGVIAVDLATFLIAFLTLLFAIRLPEAARDGEAGQETLLQAAKSGLRYLQNNRLILYLILFLAAVNFTASAFDAALPAFVLSRTGGDEAVLGVVTSCAGVATMIGSLIVTLLKKPKDRVRVIVMTMLISLGTENFILALTDNPVLWCLAQVVGWLLVPVMNANLDVVMRSSVPVEMQGRVYSCRNTLQFFTIPLGMLVSGAAVDSVFEPLMAGRETGLLPALFGTGKGSGAAIVIFLLGILGVAVCLIFGVILRKYRFEDDLT